MGLVFQAFVRNFLRREQDVFTVSSPKVPWDLEPLEGSDPAWLPDMLTDILLSSDSGRVVIETKCYAQPYQSHRGSRKLISDHLYQLLTYLAHLARTPGPPTTGVLLYAGANEDQKLDFRLGGHTVKVRGIDLEQPWQLIHRNLIDLAGELEIAPLHESPRETLGTP